MSSDDQQVPESSPSINDLVERLGSKEKEIRAEAVGAVAQLSSEMATEDGGALIPPLVTAMRWGREFGDEVFIQGLQAIQSLGPAAVPHLSSLLDDGNYMTVQIACAALVRSGDPEGGERARKLLVEFIVPEQAEIADEWKARNAVASMEAIGDEEVVDFLAKQVLESHPNQQIRAAAGRTLDRLGYTSATSPLSSPSQSTGAEDPEKPWWRFWE